MPGIPTIVTSRTRSQYERPPVGPFVLNAGSPQAQGLVAWWPLGGNGDGGGLQDFSGNNNHLTLVGSLSAQGSPLFGGLGISNTASSSNYANIGRALLQAAPLTMNAWIYLRGSTDYGTCSGLLAITNSAGSRYKCLQYDGANANGQGAHVAFMDHSGVPSASWASTTTVPGANTLNMITGTLGGTTAGTCAVGLNGAGWRTNSGTVLDLGSDANQTVVCAYRDTTVFTPLSGVQIHTTLYNRAWSQLDAVCAYDPATRWDLYFPTNTRTFVFFDTPVATGIAFDAASNSGLQAAQSTYTWSHTCTGSNRFLAVDVSLLSVGSTVTAITYNGVALTAIPNAQRSTVTAFGRVECWGLANPASGTNTISVTLSGSITSVGTAASYTNVHQTSPTEAGNSNQATNTGSATDATVDVTSVADQDWIHAALATDDAAVTANQTSRNNVSGGAANSGANEDFGPQAAGTKTMGWTGLGITATWVVAGYALRPVTAAGLSVAAGFDAFFPDSLRQHRTELLAY